jgi:hypothetical protein
MRALKSLLLSQLGCSAKMAREADSWRLPLKTLSFLAQLRSAKTGPQESWLGRAVAVWFVAAASFENTRHFPNGFVLQKSPLVSAAFRASSSWLRSVKSLRGGTAGGVESASPVAMPMTAARIRIRSFSTRSRFDLLTMPR